MVAQGGVATSICDCSISVITRSPSSLRARLRNFLSRRRTARRVLASNTKYSSSMPTVYMRAITRLGESGSPIWCRKNGRRASRRPIAFKRLWVALAAGRLAAARGVDLFLQSGKADGAHDHVGADHIARRTVEAERLGELEVLVERGFHLGA